jgi:hypothetical protein|tara:strand:+ start:8627 stop:8842 length:216 start_codon:yes stop_codon:yes gene_type:complete
MNYTETVKVQKQIKSLDRKVNKLYKEYKILEIKQRGTKDSDFYTLCIQKLDEVNQKIMALSTEREILTDSI